VRVVSEVWLARSHWLLTKKNVLLRRMGPPALNPGMCCVNSRFSSPAMLFSHSFALYSGRRSK
jgi:hypothetical protein